MGDRRAADLPLHEKLSAQVESILGLAAGLADEAAAESEGEGFDRDLARIREAGETLVARIAELLAPARLAAAHRGGDPAAYFRTARHELRTPLNHIIGYAELLFEEAEEEPGGEHLAADLRQIVDTGRKLAADLSELVRSEAGETPAISSPTPPRGSVLPSFHDRATPRPDRPPGRVLVVDDSEPNRDVLARRLERQGHTVGLAEDGREALAVLAESAWDLVLLDMMMPEMDGWEVLQRLKADDALRHVPVIMITALDDLDSVVRCLSLGAEDYLTKPFDPVILDARLGACLEKKHLRDREVMHLHQIEEEKARADRLLRVILPEPIVEELQATEQVRPRTYPDVGVLFTDVVGFTRFSDTHGAEEVVAALQELVHAFEEVAARHGLEKLKTIGDAFMAAAGLLEPVENPVASCVAAGLDMVAACRGLASGWQVRVGVHCGEVVGGVVGDRKFLFDIWGDTVNTAARMESHAEPGTVALSPTAWARVEDRFRGRSRGKVPVKGKGEMEVFLVEGLRADE